MRIERADLLKGLEAARGHLAVRTVMVARGEQCRSASAVGLLVNSRPPLELTEAQSHVFQLSLEHARRAEVEAAGSAVATLEFALRTLGGHRERLAVEGRPFVRSDLREVLEGTLEGRERDFLIEMVERAGASRYLVDRSPSRSNSVEFVDGYEFVHRSKPNEAVAMDGARVLIADAFIESEAEVRKLLEWCGREKERLLLCCRGFADDVLHTLAVNRARGTLAAYALVFPFDADDANTLVDLATIVGGDVVSSLKGQLLSSVDPAALPRAARARLRGNALELNDPSARARTDRLAAGLKEKLEASEPTAREPLERRLKRLSGSTMIVRLAASVDHAVRCERWDLALRTVRTAVRGVVEACDERAWPGRKLVPLLSEATALEYARSLVARLESLAAVA